MKTKTILLLLFFISTSIFLSFLSLFHKHWANANNQEFGLINCSLCKSFAHNWSWECMARESCYNDLVDDCSLYKNGYRGSIAYISFEISSLLIGLILLEKMILFLFKKDFGLPVIFLILLVLHWILHAFAIIFWFYLSNSIFFSSNIISKTGPMIAIISLLWQTITDGFIFYRFYKENLAYQPSDFMIQNKCCNISPRIWLSISLALLILTFSLILGSLTSDSWLQSSKYSGNLIKCDNCYPIDNLSWSCLAGTECESNSDSYSCNLYRNISNAGDAFIILSAIALLFLLLAAQPVIASIISRDYGLTFVNIVIFYLDLFRNSFFCKSYCNYFMNFYK